MKVSPPERSYPVSIFTAGDYEHAVRVCREHCDQVGLCVTVTPTTYVYTDGEEAGVIVGLINYPRFPASASDIWYRAEALAHHLRVQLKQESFTIQAPDKTVWFSWRAETAQVGRNPEGGDVKQAPSRSDEHAVHEVDAPAPSSISNPTETGE